MTPKSPDTRAETLAQTAQPDFRSYPPFFRPKIIQFLSAFSVDIGHVSEFRPYPSFLGQKAQKAHKKCIFFAETHLVSQYFLRPYGDKKKAPIKRKYIYIKDFGR